jgi:hypothetical protein
MPLVSGSTLLIQLTPKVYVSVFIPLVGALVGRIIEDY